MQKRWSGQTVLIIGVARQGLALARFLLACGAQVILNDQRSAEKLQDAIHSLEGTPVRWVLGDHPLDVLDGVTLVCPSGGVPLTLPILLEAQRRGIPLSNDSQIFMESVQAGVIGITGSAGKTTTTTLVSRMAEHHAQKVGRKAWVGGNIGQPLVEFVNEIAPQDEVVVEFSSFQLELMTCSPHIAAVLNITPNHLDRHGTMEAYTRAKANILRHQTAQDVAVLNREDSGSWALLPEVCGKYVTFGLNRPQAGLSGTFLEEGQLCFTDGVQDEILFPRTVCTLRGEHNLVNVLAACAIGIAAGFGVDSLRAGVEGFHGVAHRLEWVRNLHGVNYYNDSIASAPERTLAALHSFDEPIVLLLGGRDKKLPWEKLAEMVVRRVDHVVVFGQDGDKIMNALMQAESAICAQDPHSARLKSKSRYAGLREAFLAAAQAAQPGDVVLLSPAATSMDEFRDFEERGERFTQWVQELP